jgi:very-short-patch-repair endonuclease
VFDRPNLAARHWVVSARELAQDGFSEEEIAHRAATGILNRVHRGVYAVGRPELSFEGACLAALLACGDGCAVSHRPAGRLHGFLSCNGMIHVSGPRSLEGHPGLIVHRPRSLPPADLTSVEGIPVTSVARTLLDLSPGQPVDRIGGWIHEAVVQRRFDPRDAWAVLNRHRHHRGRRRLAAALAVEVAPTRSGLEDAFLAIVRRALLPEPVVNGKLWSGIEPEEIDFHWPDRRLIVETDGGRYHATRWRQRRDAAKDERFRAQGWEVWRIPELDITLDSAGIASRLATFGLENPSDRRV